MPSSERVDYEEKIRKLLAAVRDGDEKAFDALIETIAPELRKLSGYQMRFSTPGQTLQPTALVNEVVMRLMKRRDRAPDQFPQGKAHLLALTTRMMRFALAEAARKKAGKPVRVSIDRVDDDGMWMESTRIPELVDWTQLDVDNAVALDEALEYLERSDAKFGKRRRDVATLLIFGGMKAREIAEALEIGEDTASRDIATVRTIIGKLMQLKRRDDADE